MGETKPINISDIRSSGRVVPNFKCSLHSWWKSVVSSLVKISAYQYVSRTSNKESHFLTTGGGTTFRRTVPEVRIWSILIDPSDEVQLWIVDTSLSRIILKNPLKTPKKYGIGRWHKVNTTETSLRFGGCSLTVMFEVSVLATATQLCLLFWKLSICWSIGPLPLQFPETLQKDPKKILLGQPILLWIFQLLQL